MLKTKQSGIKVEQEEQEDRNNEVFFMYPTLNTYSPYEINSVIIIVDIEFSK